MKVILLFLIAILPVVASLHLEPRESRVLMRDCPGFAHRTRITAGGEMVTSTYGMKELYSGKELYITCSGGNDIIVHNPNDYAIDVSHETVVDVFLKYSMMVLSSIMVILISCVVMAITHE